MVTWLAVAQADNLDMDSRTCAVWLLDGLQGVAGEIAQDAEQLVASAITRSASSISMSS
jgi:hypothetical protein